MIYKSTYKSPLGQMTIAAEDGQIVGLWFRGQKYFAASIKGMKTEEKETPEIKKTKKWLDKYFAGKNPDVKELPLAPRGTDFQKMIWKLLLAVPYGKTTTYGKLAEKAAKKLKRDSMSAQAVGGAVGRNPISVIIPCHRVLGANGSLTGYAGGIKKKKGLLALEKV